MLNLLASSKHLAGGLLAIRLPFGPKVPGQAGGGAHECSVLVGVGRLGVLGARQCPSVLQNRDNRHRLCTLAGGRCQPCTNVSQSVSRRTGGRCTCCRPCLVPVPRVHTPAVRVFICAWGRGGLMKRARLAGQGPQTAITAWRLDSWARGRVGVRQPDMSCTLWCHVQPCTHHVCGSSWAGIHDPHVGNWIQRVDRKHSNRAGPAGEC